MNYLSNRLTDSITICDANLKNDAKGKREENW